MGQGVACGLVAMVVMALGLTTSASGAPGDLDPKFSEDGKVIIGWKKSVLARSVLGLAASAPKGRTIVVSTVTRKPKKSGSGHSRGVDRGKARDIAVARLSKTGAPDETYSGDGRVILRVPGNETALDVEQQSDGKTVIGGTAGNDMLLIRLTAKGALDKSFSGDGRLTVDFGLEDTTGGIAIQPDGKIVIAGSASRLATGATLAERDFAAARVTTAGLLDPSFSGDGMVTVDFRRAEDDPKEGVHDTANAIGLGPDGRIVLIGGSVVPDEYSGTLKLATAALLPNGDLDTTLAGGTVREDFPVAASTGAVGADGSIFAAGSTVPSRNIGIARLTPAGLFDTSFAGTGTASIDLGSNDDSVDAMTLLQPVGTPVLAGGAKGTRDRADFALVRLTAGGLPDPTFSEDGRLTVDLSGDFDDADSIVQQPDGKLLVAGTAGDTKAGVTRHLVAPGAADFDADGVEDVDDDCPDIYGKKPNGCPKR